METLSRNWAECSNHVHHHLKSRPSLGLGLGLGLGFLSFFLSLRTTMCYNEFMPFDLQ